MVKTSNFKTKTLMLERQNASCENAWGVALDIGYSAVKGFSPNSVYCFPAYARKITEEILSLAVPDPEEIRYKDLNTGEIWVVGSVAQNMIKQDESKDSITALYGRNRYYTPMFKVISRVGLALGMRANSYGSPNGKSLVVQTGLPPAYMKSDSDFIRDVLSGEHKFAIKIASGDWIDFSFSLPIENVRVMPQPMGTLLSISTDNTGKFIPEARKYFSSNMLIFDPGFGTLDIFNIENRLIKSYETFDDLGMKRVLSEASDEIFKKYKTEIPVPAMQKYLAQGEITIRDRKLRKTTKQPFDDILDAANTKVCEEALAKTEDIFNYLFDHDYLVITGGTGAAWNDIIVDHFKDMETLTIIPGNQNDTLPYTFSNVRGYYMYLLSKLKKIEKK
jgi:plasmid segregation protein ParM